MPDKGYAHGYVRPSLDGTGHLSLAVRRHVPRLTATTAGGRAMALVDVTNAVAAAQSAVEAALTDCSAAERKIDLADQLGCTSTQAIAARLVLRAELAATDELAALEQLVEAAEKAAASAEEAKAREELVARSQREAEAARVRVAEQARAAALQQAAERDKEQARQQAIRAAAEEAAAERVAEQARQAAERQAQVCPRAPFLTSESLGGAVQLPFLCTRPVLSIPESGLSTCVVCEAAAQCRAF